ncbi:MAG: hypothetical protein C0484_03280 [Rhodospirillum sp.]|nr:hypothetical protein [Rhodospirillum sp.]
MGWIRHLPSIVASSLLFGFIGLPLGTAAFFTILHLTADRPTSYRGFVDFLIGPGFVIAVIAGAVPAFATGVIAGILRIYIRALWLLAGVMAPVGAAMTAVYTELLNSLFGWHGVPKQGEIILTGGIAAFLCTFLLWRNRPWLITRR